MDSQRLTRFRIATGVVLAVSAVVVMLAARPAATEAPAEPVANRQQLDGQPKVGQQAPDFTLKTVQGEELQLSKLLSASPVVLVQLRGWVGYQCPLCTRQTGELIAKADELKAAGAQVILSYPGPAADSLQGYAQDFLKDVTLPEHFRIVLDPEMKVVDSYGLRWDEKDETAYPATFVIDKEGVVRFARISDSHGGRSSPAEVLEALHALK